MEISCGRKFLWEDVFGGKTYLQDGIFGGQIFKGGRFS